MNAPNALYNADTGKLENLSLEQVRAAICGNVQPITENPTRQWSVKRSINSLKKGSIEVFKRVFGLNYGDHRYPGNW